MTTPLQVCASCAAVAARSELPTRLTNCEGSNGGASPNQAGECSEQCSGQRETEKSFGYDVGFGWSF